MGGDSLLEFLKCIFCKLILAPLENRGLAVIMEMISMTILAKSNVGMFVMKTIFIGCLSCFQQF